MKLKDFRKMLRGLPGDAEIMLVADWMQYTEDGHPCLCSANHIEVVYSEPSGWNDDGSVMAYIYNVEES